MGENEAFISLKEMIKSERSLDVSQYKENYLKRRLAVRMRALSINLYGEYVEFLKKNTNEYNILMDKLTINVTQFFRDPEVFIAFENEILPKLFAEGRKKISIWSAGCSSGEEPYSLAISIKEAAEKWGYKDIEYEIYATDIDQVILYKAIEGVYEGRTLENIAPNRRNKYFTEKNKTYKVVDEIKQHIKFVRVNLMEPFKEDCFDLVFCRNVIIYFTKDLQNTVLQYFHDSMKKDSILFLGKTETMLLNFRDRFKCINIKERIFKKEPVK